MRLALNTHRLLARAPRVGGWTLVEGAVIALVAMQCARLVWVAVTPVGPVGDWRAEGTQAQAPSPEALSGFDPFFRLSGEAGPVTVTALNLTLHGVRQDQASGRGSAIIGTPDGKQRSYAVGDEVAPGVTLTGVGFDHVTLSRGGASEQLYMDQSGEAKPVGPTAPATPGPRVPAVTAPPPPAPVTEIGFTPRTSGGRVTGVAVRPQGSGDAFRALGFAPGDVIVGVNGRRIGSAADIEAVAGQLGPRSTVQVERDGRVLALRGGGR